MVLRLSDKWVWDFWFVRDNDDAYHFFYLQAPRALGDPSLRHHNATIGHSVSVDCRDWRVLPDALHPGDRGSWDDLATWTGSTISYRDKWYMLYTGISRADEGLIQRIGLATSVDLVHWDKHPRNPLLQADPRWYETLGDGRWRDEAWRDPWLFQHPDDGGFHTLITARSPVGPPEGAGILGQARSTNLVDGEVLPPLTEPGEFAQVEVPQLLRLDGHYTILFSCNAPDHSPARVQRLGFSGQAGTFTLSAKDFAGPYKSGHAPVSGVRGPLGTLYAGKLLEPSPGQYRFIAFRGDGEREFLGELTDPLVVETDGEGGIRVITPV
jgi:beta-fructofuranosidase